MIIQIAKDVFVNPNQILLFKELNTDSSPIVYLINRQGTETKFFVDKPRLRQILDKFPNFLSIGKDFVNVDEIVFIRNNQDFDLELTDGYSYMYSEDELSLSQRDKILELFQMESVYSEDGELFDNQLEQYERLLNEEETEDDESF
jgi:hypothetical protein